MFGSADFTVPRIDISFNTQLPGLDHPGLDTGTFAQLRKCASIAEAKEKDRVFVRSVS